MRKISIEGIIKTSIVTAFTIATALIWKDVITDAIQKFFPASDILLYEFLTALIATIILIVVLYAILKTEEETEIVWKRFHTKNNKNEIIKKYKPKNKSKNI